MTLSDRFPVSHGTALGRIRPVSAHANGLIDAGPLDIQEGAVLEVGGTRLTLGSRDRLH